MVCGYAHTMALTDEGKLFVWGSNVHGQLGLGTKANAVEPVQVGTELGRSVTTINLILRKNHEN